jgi:hypothetical protein
MESYEKLVEKDRFKTSLSREVLRSVANFFHHREGQMETKGRAVSQVSIEADITELKARIAIDNLVVDSVDPVTQISTDDGDYVGVISYEEDDFFYTYTDYHDRFGEQKKSVCAQCVNEELPVEQVHHYTRSTENYDYDEARSLLAAHYLLDHEDMTPEEVVSEYGDGSIGLNIKQDVSEVAKLINVDEIDISVKTGASLISGSTVGGNLMITSANGSNLAIESLTTSSAQGTVPQSKGDGTLEMVQVDSPVDVLTAGTLINL